MCKECWVELHPILLRRRDEACSKTLHCACVRDRKGEWNSEKVKEKWLLPEGLSKIYPTNLWFTALLTCYPSVLFDCSGPEEHWWPADKLWTVQTSWIVREKSWRVKSTNGEAALPFIALLIWNKLQKNKRSILILSSSKLSLRICCFPLP